ncbi:MAG: hypothetical protein IKI30_07050 [Oxalobacter sp.]|nr:hypothetical protein [Oxalobacter sp.]
MQVFKKGLVTALLAMAMVPTFAGNHHIALNNILMGGYFDGKWLPTASLQGPTWLWGGEDATVFYPDGKRVEGVACAIDRDHPDEEGLAVSDDEPDAPVFSVQLPSYRSVSYPSHTLVVTWTEGNLMPRAVQSLPPDNVQYKALVADFLAGRGLPYKQVVLTKLLKVDLDGNDADEVIITGHAAGGKVPFAMLRQIQQGNVATTMLAEPSDGKVTDLFTADLNGDGRMEIALATQSKTQIHQMVYTVNQGNTDRVIRNSWPLHRQ